MGFVNWAPSFEFSLCLAGIYSSTMDTSFEEAGAPLRINDIIDILIDNIVNKNSD